MICGMKGGSRGSFVILFTPDASGDLWDRGGLSWSLSQFRGEGGMKCSLICGIEGAFVVIVLIGEGRGKEVFSDLWD